MTKLLEEAFAKASKLPRWEQDALAAMILEEIADNQQWKESCLHTQESDEWLAKLVNDALQAEHA
ncbi:MAG: hypothetical protein D6706_07580 [Chloroflexi bacterium]|nr:MAG: hypothetical protein D6706_07580 [Chloroflexota bacterium]